jgi:hypothetical protein
MHPKNQNSAQECTMNGAHKNSKAIDLEDSRFDSPNWTWDRKTSQNDLNGEVSTITAPQSTQFKHYFPHASTSPTHRTNYLSPEV